MHIFRLQADRAGGCCGWGCMRCDNRWKRRWTGSTSSIIRVQEFFQSRDVQLASHLRARPTALRHARVEAELITFARQQSASARLGEHLVGKSEVEESVFGKVKSLERDQSSSGFARYVVSLGALVGDSTTSSMKKPWKQLPRGLLKPGAKNTC